jgi:hypothetical protein
MIRAVVSYEWRVHDTQGNDEVLHVDRLSQLRPPHVEILRRGGVLSLERHAEAWDTVTTSAVVSALGLPPHFEDCGAQGTKVPIKYQREFAAWKEQS